MSSPTYKRVSAWMWSAAAVATMAVLLSVVSDWHNSVKNFRPVGRILEQASPTDIDMNDSPANSIDDDITRDQTCREYLMNFLNGTTDAKDECQGMYNAWQAGDCTDESVIFPVNSDLKRKHRADNGTILEDDVLIDDFYENWECCSSISDFYDKHCQQPQLDSMKLCGIVVVLVICGLMKSIIRLAGARWIPDAGACIVVGSIVGGILRMVSPDVVAQRLTFDNDLFLHILLPPIIFEAALSIDKRAFRRDLFPILVFAIFGTFFTAVAIGYIVFYLSAIGGGTALPFLDSLLFGALASSIDPVATLSILSSVGVSQGDALYTLIFGESLLNDGVSIVLFDSLVRHVGDSDVVDGATVQDTLWNFVMVISGSVLVGGICGALCTVYFWALQGKNTAVTEVAVFFSWALVPYYIADGVGYSGIISIMVMGFMLDYFVIGGFQSDEGEWMDYMNRRCHSDMPHPVEPVFGRLKEWWCKAFSGRGHILTKSRHHVGFVAEVISSIMETAIFAYLGLFLFSGKIWDLKLTSAGIFACVSSRAVQVVVLCLIVNACVYVDLEGKLARLWRTVSQRTPVINLNDDDDSYGNEPKVYLDGKTQFSLFSAGIRGAVSMALVQNIPIYDSVTKQGSHFKAELKAMTSATIVVLLFVFGAMTYFTVQRDVNRGPREESGNLSERLLHTQQFSVLASDDGQVEDGEDGDMDNESDLNSFEIEGRHNISTPRREVQRGGL
jgi:NhaP-type Na+/H+ or K+/H+ antiporter